MKNISSFSKVVFIMMAISFGAFAQDAPPPTDVWLIQFQKNKTGVNQFSSAKKITENPGYDNQPFFLPMWNSMFYVSDANNKQTDIYQYDLLSGASKKILSTEYYKEYSPMLSPDSKQINCVRVEPDDSSQRFWSFPAGGGIGKVLFPDITDIGYYCWLGNEQVAFFRLGEKFTLHLANTTTQTISQLDENVGRCIQYSRRGNLMYYVKKYDSLNWEIKVYDLTQKVLVGEIPLPSNTEDFTLGPNDELWLSYEGKVCTASLTDKKWKPVFDFTNQPFKNFYRIVYSPELNMLAVVTYEGKKP